MKGEDRSLVRRQALEASLDLVTVGQGEQAIGGRRFSRQRGSMPIFQRNGSCRASCRKPPANTAQASTSTGGSKRSAKNAAPTMNERFSSTGVIAGTANRLQVFRMPAASATSEMQTM